MWLEILCGLVVYRFLRSLFSDDENLDIETSGSDANFVVAKRIEKIYGGKVFVGLRIPDIDSGSRQSIDMVLVTKEEAIVIAVRSFSGFVEVDADGNWVCTGKKEHKKERHPDPVVEIRKQVAILESYLKQRGVSLPAGCLTGRVILPNSNCRTPHSVNILSEVISYDKWTQLKPETKSGFSHWIKDAFRGGKNDMQGIYQQLHFILSTAPMWDRLELKGRNVLGEFLEFKGTREDMQALREVKRSKVSRLIIQKSTMFGLIGRSMLQVLYAPRDFRSEGASASEWKELTVKSSTEVLFQPLNDKKVRKFKLSSIDSLSLSA